MQKRRKKRYRLKKWVKTTLWILLIIILLVIALITFLKYQKNKPKNNELPDISALRLEYNNSDIMAKITIKSIGLDALVTKTNNNEYYLEHDINKKKSDIGNPYFDYRNSNDLAHEKQINIYSHNVENKQYSEYYPFSKLEKLLDGETFNKSDELILYTDNRILKYQIYAIKIITSKDIEHMRFVTNENDWQNHLDILMSNNKYCKHSCKLDESDDILILQTCYYKENDSYILVIAKKV